jgi:DNA-binding response OmpR family regulator
MASHILLVDDDALLRRSLAFNLEQAGYRVSTAASAEDALALAQRDRPSLVLLDIGLPGMDGLDALRRFQAQTNAPVIFLTARRRELDEVLGLELGADDYVTKPFDLDVLLARIKVVLRRSERATPTAAEPTPLTVGDVVVDPATHTVIVGGRPVDLPPREFDLLHVLADVEPEAVWIRVSDTGPGIPPEEQAYIFTPFYRGCSVGRFPQGMGLGLTIARDLVVAHGGRLEVESTPGQGSRFTLRIPLASPNQG